MLSSNKKLSLIMSASGLGVALGLILGFHYRRKICYLAWKFRTNELLKKDKKIYIISNARHWENIAEEFCRSAKAASALGFDCEWIQLKGNRRPVALMQLATHTGMCALIRMNILQNHIPLSLKEILEDSKIVKSGVSPDHDAAYLMQDYGIMVNGWLDLRHLVVKNTNPNAEREVQEKLGLQGLAKRFLGKTLNKDWRVRQGNWEAGRLTKIQAHYAAEDALVGIHVLLCVLNNMLIPNSSLPPFRLKDWEAITSEAVHELCLPVSEIRFVMRTGGQVETNRLIKKLDGMSFPPHRSLKKLRTSYSIRKSPLYHNSLLEAPDGEMLCTCDPKKGYWYVEKGLGHLISEDPLIVRLRFEPAGRPNKEGVDGQFYLQERLNLCVVCGKKESYIRKNIIPHEYRKHFPRILKSHQSHDVVLLCTDCHQRSNIKDMTLRYTLARECDAPIGCEVDVKARVDRKLKAVRSAGGALRKSCHQLPPSRIQHLEGVLKEFYQTEVLTEEQINMASELDTQIMNEGYMPHGYKVFLHYKNIGLIQLEQRWRQWFLDSMGPQYLPEKWSISHNHQKLRMKMSRYPLASSVREDYKVALVGTEGQIDISYVPQKNKRKPSSFFGLNDENKQESEVEDEDEEEEEEEAEEEEKSRT